MADNQQEIRNLAQKTLMWQKMIQSRIASDHTESLYTDLSKLRYLTDEVRRCKTSGPESLTVYVHNVSFIFRTYADCGDNVSALIYGAEALFNSMVMLYRIEHSIPRDMACSFMLIQINQIFLTIFGPLSKVEHNTDAFADAPDIMADCRTLFRIGYEELKRLSPANQLIQSGKQIYDHVSSRSDLLNPSITEFCTFNCQTFSTKLQNFLKEHKLYNTEAGAAFNGKYNDIFQSKWYPAINKLDKSFTDAVIDTILNSVYECIDFSKIDDLTGLDLYHSEDFYWSEAIPNGLAALYKVCENAGLEPINLFWPTQLQIVPAIKPIDVIEMYAQMACGYLYLREKNIGGMTALPEFPSEDQLCDFADETPDYDLKMFIIALVQMRIEVDSTFVFYNMLCIIADYMDRSFFNLTVDSDHKISEKIQRMKDKTVIPYIERLKAKGLLPAQWDYPLFNMNLPSFM